MDRAIRASRLFRAEPATFQPHSGVVQELAAFHTNNIHRGMMIPAMDANHRFHCFPFAVQPLVCKTNSFAFGLDRGKRVRRGWFNAHFHAVIFARQEPVSLDASQGSGRFLTRD
jgi:hypothetical protein